MQFHAVQFIFEQMIGVILNALSTKTMIKDKVPASFEKMRMPNCAD